MNMPEIKVNKNNISQWTAKSICVLSAFVNINQEHEQWKNTIQLLLCLKKDKLLLCMNFYILLYIRNCYASTALVTVLL